MFERDTKKRIWTITQGLSYVGHAHTVDKLVLNTLFRMRVKYPKARIVTIRFNGQLHIYADHVYWAYTTLEETEGYTDPFYLVKEFEIARVKYKEEIESLQKNYTEKMEKRDEAKKILKNTSAGKKD